MFYAIRPETSLRGLPRDTEKVHLIRPISHTKLRALVQRCPQLQEIGMSPTVEKRLTSPSKELLHKKGVKVVRFHRPGRALNIDMGAIRQIADLKRDFLSLREIATRTGIPKSTVHYLLTKSKRQKVHHHKKIMYVQ